MKPSSSHSQIEAFSLIELFIIIFIIVVSIAFAFSEMTRAKRESRQKVCANNLRQVGLAFRLWPSDSSDLFPMMISKAGGGSLEYIATGETFRHFQVMSNELVTPKLLVCPSDTRLTATNFTTGLSNTNISYFVGVDAEDGQPEMLLSGDRNITNGLSPTNEMLILTTNIATGWTRAMHKRAGNVGLADGSVLFTNTLGLQKLIANTGVATNRVQLP